MKQSNIKIGQTYLFKGKLFIVSRIKKGNKKPQFQGGIYTGSGRAPNKYYDKNGIKARACDLRVV